VIVVAAAAVIATDPGLRQPDRGAPATRPEVSAPNAAAQGPSRSASPAPSDSATRRSPSPSRPLASTPAALTVRQATDALYGLLDKGLAEKSIGQDAANDLRQLITNFGNSPSADPALRAQALAALHGSLRDRVNTGAITDQRLATDLDTGITALGTAVERTMASGSPRPAAS
jgi:hypothetical protein